MIASSNLISSNFSCILSRPHSRARPRNATSLIASRLLIPQNDSSRLKYCTRLISHYHHEKNDKKKSSLLTCSCSVSDDPIVEKGDSDTKTGDENDGGGDSGDWTTSILLFLFWAAVMYYIFNLAPNQTPSRDMYFLKKLSNLVGDDGFRMNQVLVPLWYVMGLWPVVYSMLLIPSGRSSKSKIPVWPFLILSFFGGAFGLVPYFILWRPPSPPIEEGELRRWPLNFLESKITAAVLGVAGLGLIAYATLSTGDWKEFSQYFRESKLVHATSLDFCLLSAFAPFWAYNDMTARQCYDRTAWLLPFTIIPFLGPVFYILLRPPLNTMPVSIESTLKSE